MIQVYKCALALTQLFMTLINKPVSQIARRAVITHMEAQQQKSANHAPPLACIVLED